VFLSKLLRRRARACLNLSARQAQLIVESMEERLVPASLTSISITPVNSVVAPGGTEQLTAIGTFSNGATQDLTSQVTWKSSNTGLLPSSDISSNGLVAAPAGTNTGQTTVTASEKGIDGSTTLTIDVAPVLPPFNGNNSIVLPNNQFPFAGTLGASSPVGNSLSYSVLSTSGESLLFDLQQQYQFRGLGYRTAGATAYLLHSNQPGTGFHGSYLLRPSDGALFPYDGSGSFAHTFANGTALAILGSNVYTDPTLLLNALPPADYATLFNLQQQYQFKGLGYSTRGAEGYLLKASTNNSFGNPDYVLSPAGVLYAYDGSGSYAHTYANVTPIVALGPSIYSFPNELLNARSQPATYSQLYSVEQQYDLQEFDGSFRTNYLGNQAKWLYSPVLNQYGEHWYTLILAGGQSVLRAWEGYQDSSVGAVVATFNTASVYNDATLLTKAIFLPNPAVTATIDPSGNLTVGLPNSAYVGTFNLVVSATDGLLSTSEAVTVTSTDSLTLSVKQGANVIDPGSTQSFTHGAFPQGLTYSVAEPGGQSVTTTASVSSYSQLFALQQSYRFRGVGYRNLSGTAYVLNGARQNSFGNSTYLLSPAGNLYAYDDSGSYTHTFTNQTALANLGSNVYADPTLLTKAQPPVDYTTLFNLQQQYQFTTLGYFTRGAKGYLLRAATNNSFGNPYYVLSPAGGLYALDSSGSYAHTFANVTPVANLEPGVYVNPSLLVGATAPRSLYYQFVQVEQELDLSPALPRTSTFLAKWLYSPVPNTSGQHYDVLFPDGTLYAWDGTSTSPKGNSALLLGTLDSSVYANPTLLTNARAQVAAIGVTASAVGGTLTLNAPASFVGKFQVTLTATDGSLTTTETFQVASTDMPPVANTIPPQTASTSGSPLQITLSSTDAENDFVTYTAAAVGYNPAYKLQQLYHFKGLGYRTVGGVKAYLLRSAILQGRGGLYLLNNSGAVYAYDGSGSYAHTFANPANLIATLDPSVYTTPTLLTNVVTPTPPSAIVSVIGNTLRVNVAGVAVGTVFEVVITASDGAETRSTNFLITVTA
jgi:Bacterial Ig-like domain (group 2)